MARIAFRPRNRVAGALLIAGMVAASTSGFAAHTVAPVHAAGQTLLVARDISDGKTMDPGRFYEFTSYYMAANC